MVLFIYDYSTTSGAVQKSITRNEYGEGSRLESLMFKTWDGEKAKIDLKIGEREYNSEEIQEIFKSEMKRLDHLILGDNKSLEEVSKDLNLIREIPDIPIGIEWQSSRYDLVNNEGKLSEKISKKDGEAVTLKATLSYNNRQEEQAFYQRTILVFPPQAEDKKSEVEYIEKTIREAEESTRENKELRLPTSLDGKKIWFYRSLDNRGITIMVCGLLAGVLLFYKKKQSKAEEEKERKRQMQVDYPEIVNKITLLIGAGMILSAAWERIVSDYERHKKDGEKRYAYEEMHKTMQKIKLGQVEAFCYEEYGKNCKLKEYLKLGSLLSQNVRKGNKDLCLRLREESYLAFEDRKMRGKRNGEEAGTKLLLPMFLMLLVSLIIIIVPAFLSIQIK